MDYTPQLFAVAAILCCAIGWWILGGEINDKPSRKRSCERRPQCWEE